MDRAAIAERLRALASDDKKRSKAARLRDVIDDVEAALRAGVSRSSVVEELAAQGLVMTLSTFETTVKRIRKQRGASLNATSKHPRQTTGQVQEQNTTPLVVTAETEVSGSHDPAALDAIIASKPDLAALAKHAKTKRKTK